MDESIPVRTLDELEELSKGSVVQINFDMGKRNNLPHLLKPRVALYEKKDENASFIYPVIDGFDRFQPIMKYTSRLNKLTFGKDSDEGVIYLPNESEADQIFYQHRDFFRLANLLTSTRKWSSVYNQSDLNRLSHFS